MACTSMRVKQDFLSSVPATRFVYDGYRFDLKRDVKKPETMKSQGYSTIFV